jgi:hypothetical protein
MPDLEWILQSARSWGDGAGSSNALGPVLAAWRLKHDLVAPTRLSAPRSLGIPSTSAAPASYGLPAGWFAVAARLLPDDLASGD